MSVDENELRRAVEDRLRVSARVLALLDAEAGRRLRLRHLGNPEVYAELQAVEEIAEAYRLGRAAGSATATGIDAGGGPAAEWVTTTQAAALAGVRPVTIRRALAEGRIHGVRVGRQWLIPPAEVARYVTHKRHRT